MSDNLPDILDVKAPAVRGDLVRPVPATKLWRYMDFAKFVSMLDTQSLFFARSDLLGDEFEFSYPKANYEAFKGTALEANNNFFSWMTRTFATTLFVSCWCANEHESTAMWSEYLRGQQGVAILTTFQRLNHALMAAPHLESLDLGLINYVNYDTDRINDQRLLSFIYHKRIQYAHEKEFRAVYWLTPSDGVITSDQIDPSVNTTTGFAVETTLGQLIEKIVVSPTSPSWLFKLVESVTKRFGVEVPVVASSLAGSPRR